MEELRVDGRFYAFDGFLRTEIREEVHLQGIRELRRRAEREVDVLPQNFRDVRPRHMHPRRELRLRHAKLLHPPQYPPQKRRPDFIYRLHSPRATFIRAILFITISEYYLDDLMKNLSLIVSHFRFLVLVTSISTYLGVEI